MVCEFVCGCMYHVQSMNWSHYNKCPLMFCPVSQVSFYQTYKSSSQFVWCDTLLQLF